MGVRFYFVEKLTVSTWLTAIWPKLRGDGCWRGGVAAELFYIDADKKALLLARAMLGQCAVHLNRLEFDAEHMHDEEGMLLWLRIYYRDMAQALSWIEKDLLHTVNAADPVGLRNYLLYLRKECLPGDSVGLPYGLWRAVYVLHVCLWVLRRDGVSQTSSVLFLGRRSWMGAFLKYVSAIGPIEVIPVGRAFNFARFLRRLLGRELRVVLEKWQRIFDGRLRPLQKVAQERNGDPVVALHYYGHFNLDEPEKHSDFFYFQQSTLPGKNLLALFGLPQDPLNEQRLTALKRHGIGALALRYSATTMPLLTYGETELLRRMGGAMGVFSTVCASENVRWLRAEAIKFDAEKRYWRKLFKCRNIKVYATWYKYDAEHCAVAEALEDVGGALAIYQRAYEGNATPQATLSTDILFAFSGVSAQVEAECASRINYCVVTGYLGDHRFPLVRKAAQDVRSALNNCGARFIAAYFDEGSYDDPRWGISYSRLRAQYNFLLERVLCEEDFGLILKPKTPRTLRLRLGADLVEMLDRATATGRCYLYGDGVLQGSIPPAQAALSADLAIHCSVAAGTAAIEAALAGVPAVMLDEDGWTISPLSRLDKGCVIFNDLHTLWYTWREHRVRPLAVPGFADWSSILPSLDPFRDGRAAERMGTYLKWLIEGFELGRQRDVVLADAAERYRRAWGADKVIALTQL